VDTDVAVTVTGTAATPVTLSIDGASAANGTATINGAPTHDITGTETVKLKGVDQTTPGNAGKLKLVASQGATHLKKSNAFSVAAYPKEIGFKFNRVLLGETFPDAPQVKLWGAGYDLTFVSDSGVGADCDKTKVSENVFVDTSTGVFAGAPLVRSGFGRTTDYQMDRHAYFNVDAASARNAISRNPGSVLVQRQLFRFACERSNIAQDRAASPEVPTSGFKISIRCAVVTRTCGSSSHIVHVKKEGLAHNGVAAGTVDDTDEKDATVS
jgi:hypothetical protein